MSLKNILRTKIYEKSNRKGIRTLCVFLSSTNYLYNSLLFFTFNVRGGERKTLSIIESRNTLGIRSNCFNFIITIHVTQVYVYEANQVIEYIRTREPTACESLLIKGPTILLNPYAAHLLETGDYKCM